MFLTAQPLLSLARKIAVTAPGLALGVNLLAAEPVDAGGPAGQLLAAETSRVFEPISILQGQWQSFEGVSWGCNGRITAMAAAADGRIYVGGSFTVCGAVGANNIAIYDPQTNQYATLGEGRNNGVGSSVSAIEVVGEQVFVGGSFTQAGGLPIRNVAIWNGESWQATGEDVSFQLSVNALHWSEGRLYIGGSFNSFRQEGQTIPARKVAVWENGIWSPLGDGLDGEVNAIHSWEDLVFFGGRFEEAGGQAVSNIVAWDGQAYSPLIGPSGEGVAYPALPSSVRVEALASKEEGLFVAGRFEQAGGLPASNIAFWDGESWSTLAVAGLNGLNARVRALQVQGDELLAAGRFTNASGPAVGRVARWNGSSWQSLGPLGSGIPDEDVYALAWHGSNVYVGGTFDRSTAGPANRAARFNANDGWQAMGAGGYMGIGGEVLALLTEGDSVFVGGDFFTAGDLLTQSIARWDGQAWQELVPGGIPGSVRALALDQDGSLLIGGQFTIPGSPSLRNAARWNGAAFEPITPGARGFAAQVRAFSVDHEGEICAVGAFSQVVLNDGNLAANRVACWNGGAWQALGSGVASTARAVAHFNGELYVAGGAVTTAGGQAVNRIARWDGSAWQALGTPPNDGVNTFGIEALLPTSTALVVAGNFSSVNSLPGVGQAKVASWDGSQWLAQPGPLSTFTVRSLAPLKQGVVAAGEFLQSSGDFVTLLNRVGYWNGQIWQSLGPVEAQSGGVSTGVQALAATDKRIWVGGKFSEAGNQAAAGLAVFTIRDIFRDRFETTDP